MTAHLPKVKRQAQRLRVFGFCKQFMEERHRAPMVTEVAEALDLTYNVVCTHMLALNGADGLPFELFDGTAKSNQRYAPLNTAMPVDAFFKHNGAI